MKSFKDVRNKSKNIVTYNCEDLTIDVEKVCDSYLVKINEETVEEFRTEAAAILAAKETIESINEANRRNA